MAPAPGQHARRIAWQVLNDLERSGLTLDRILDRALAGGRSLSRTDRALIHSLVFGVQRWRGRIDWILARFSKTRLPKIDPPVLNLLRLGVFQIAFLTRIPPSAAVNTAVELAKTGHPPWVVKFVNGVLRGTLRGLDGLSLPPVETDPETALAAGKSLPPWLVRRWIDRYGTAGAAALGEAINTIPPITLRTNTLRATRESLLADLFPAAASAAPTPVAPDGIHLTGPDRPVFDLPLFSQGAFAVQDEAAQLVSCLVAPRPGERVLDACAGLGGKTGHLAQLMTDRGELVALDRSREKIARLQDEMARLGVACVTARVQDLADPLHLAPFDRVLLDAPCTGLGVLRRNPDGKWSRQPEDIARCARDQRRLLDCLAGRVKPGGRMVFAVCSMEPEENESVVEAFLEGHGEFAPEPAVEDLPGPARALICPDGYFRTAPHRHDMDGFFAAVLRRI